MMVTLNDDWSDGNTQVQNRRGEWVPAIPLPLFIFPHRHQCHCGRRFWRLAAYQGHFALEHILALEPWVERWGNL